MWVTAVREMCFVFLVFDLVLCGSALWVVCFGCFDYLVVACLNLGFWLFWLYVLVILYLAGLCVLIDNAACFVCWVVCFVFKFGLIILGILLLVLRVLNLWSIGLVCCGFLGFGFLVWFWLWIGCFFSWTRSFWFYCICRWFKLVTWFSFGFDVIV